MAFEEISVGMFLVGLLVSFSFFAAAIAVGKFFQFGSPDDSMVPNVKQGLIVGFLAVLGTITFGSTIGFGCADAEYYEGEVDTPEESDYFEPDQYSSQPDDSIEVRVES